VDGQTAGADAQKKTLIATERDEAARAAWRQEVAATAPETLVFLDETSTHTGFTRMYGLAPRGDRVLGQVPRNHGPNVSCLMAISPTSDLAPLAIEGAIDGAVFVRWLREWLLPTLPVGATIICDNLSVHRHQAVRPAVEAAGCHLRYLPPYSPDFNPIEQVFSTLRTRLRAAASRTFDPLGTSIGAALSVITADHLANYTTTALVATTSPHLDKTSEKGVGKIDSQPLNRWLPRKHGWAIRRYRRPHPNSNPCPNYC
jgi:transposase